MKKNRKLILQLFVLGMCWASVYALGFIQYLLYEPFKEALGCTNKQLGLLMTIFGLGNIFGAPLGGWIADRFDYKKVYVLSLIANGILAIIFSMNMNYKTAVIIWIGLAVTTLVMNYPSHIKIIRMMSNGENQGKLFGLNEAFVGVADVIINTIFIFIFAKFIEAKAGMQAVSLLIGIISLSCAIAAWFILKDIESNSEDVEEVHEKITAKDFFVILKSPETWLLGLGIFAVYSLTVTMSYFTPYITSVLGGTVALSGVLSIIRLYGLRLVGAPFGGWLSDKIKSVSKVLILIYIIGMIILITFIKFPGNMSILIFVILTFIIGFIAYMGKGIYYAVESEINIPKHHFATTVGIAAALGFSPDAFLFTLSGHWLDKYGNDGYNYIFMFQIAVLFIGLLGSLYLLKRKRKTEQMKV